ncbi:MAG TPA: hypothetical protein VF510_07565 [Ktedonobacterales bacterium]
MHPSEMEPTADSESLQSKQASRSALRTRLGAFGAIVAVCLIVALFAVLMLRPSSLFGVSPTVPANWQTYHDPRGLFSVQMPAEWTASVDTTTESFGDNTGSATETEEMILFSDPALGEASARVYVSATPIQSDFERHWYCQSFGQANPLPHDIPPETLSPGPFLFNTANAHFQVSAVIPGVLGPPHSSPAFPPPTPTPLPSQTVVVDRTVLSMILGSFLPTNTTPLFC